MLVSSAALAVAVSAPGWRLTNSSNVCYLVAHDT
jgi:hypothetical protein